MDKNIINIIGIDILKLFNQVLKSTINPKSGTNLIDSNLDREAKSQYDGDETFSLLYNDYLQYIESGRRPFARKVPFNALVSWAKRKGIPSDNNTIFAIRESIYQVGIKARLVLEPYGKLLDEQWEKSWSDKIFEIITNELDKNFNK